jgi:hypothetical protein
MHHKELEDCLWTYLSRCNRALCLLFTTLRHTVTTVRDVFSAH